MITMADLVPGTIGVCRGGKIAVVTEVVPSRPQYPIIVKFKAGDTAYKVGVSAFTTILGKIDLQAFEGSGLALTLPTVNRDDPFRPMELRDLKAGDAIIVSHGFKQVQATYGGYNSRRPTYPLTYEINGKIWKGPVSSFVRKVA